MSQLGSVILEVSNLRTSFFAEGAALPAVDDVSFKVARGKTLGIVGESGCGKSVTSLSVMRLIPEPPGKILGGEIKFNGSDLLKLSNREMRKIRGNKISMIFQEPMTSLNPVFTVGNQICETLRLHRGLDSKSAVTEAIEMLRKVGIPAPESRIWDYPHQLSGGMRQRVMIAMALACNPDLLIADEPTTALDVTIQAQILELLKSLQSSLGMGLILITHDLGIVAEVADEVLVMYAGKVVEQAATHELFKNPKHPYTIGLLHSVPELGRNKSRLATIPGLVPSLKNLPQGCRFQDRCPLVEDRCRREVPPLVEVNGGGAPHWVRCVRDVQANQREVLFQ